MYLLYLNQNQHYLFKKLYDMGNSKYEDEAKKYARFQAVSLRHNLLKGA